jgi:hypothetical protein
MSYIKGSELNKHFVGSLGHRMELLQAAIRDEVGEDVAFLSTREDGTVFACSDGSVKKAVCKLNKDGTVKSVKVEDADIEVVDDEDLPVHVASEVRSVAEKMLTNDTLDDETRTQVRELAQVVDGEEDYWLTDVLAKLEEATKDTKWMDMYEANTEKIRTSLYGSIREIEGKVPRTRYRKIDAEKLSEFEEELIESICQLGTIAEEIVDECTPVVFHGEQEEFFGAVRDSLIAEAQTLHGLLGKAAKLVGSELGRLAEAHDRLAERAKVMAIVSEYLKARARHNEE